MSLGVSFGELLEDDYVYINEEMRDLITSKS